MSDKSEEYIWNSLKDRKYDSTITIVLISPNMKEAYKWDRSQWIPWEIAYSIRETTRNNYTSYSIVVIGVILPDKYNSYSYFNNLRLFNILKANVDNGYIPIVKWDDFKYKCDYYYKCAIACKESVSRYRVVKSV